MDPPWRNHWCPRWRSCGLLRERRQPEHHQPCTRLKSITIHLVSPTTIACETQERKKERKREKEKCVNVDHGWYALCSWEGRLIRERRVRVSALWFFPQKYKAVPSWSLNIKDHHHRHYRLSGESTKTMRSTSEF